MNRHPLFTCAAALLTALSCSAAFSQGVQSSTCGPLTNHYGPYDYRVNKAELGIVEMNHFTPRVESLIGGETGTVGGEIAYTLHTYPNHHRALLSMSRLGEKLKTDQPPGVRYVIECYFERALRFQPNDTVARGLYAQYLQKKGRKAEAITQIDIAAGYAKENPFSVYNIGLLYFDAGEYGKAVTQAHLAQEMGFQRTELMDMLKQANKWQDAPPPAAAAAPAATPAATPASAPAADPAAAPASAPAK